MTEPHQWLEGAVSHRCRAAPARCRNPAPSGRNTSVWLRSAAWISACRSTRPYGRSGLSTAGEEIPSLAKGRRPTALPMKERAGANCRRRVAPLSSGPALAPEAARANRLALPPHAARAGLDSRRRSARSGARPARALRRRRPAPGSASARNRSRSRRTTAPTATMAPRSSPASGSGDSERRRRYRRTSRSRELGLRREALRPRARRCSRDCAAAWP